MGIFIQFFDAVKRRKRRLQILSKHPRRWSFSAQLIALGALVLLSGCASVNPQPFVGPSGNYAYSMKCSGMGRDWDDCLQKAGELCPDGYSIVGQTEVDP
jgi:hypothetical protein